MTDQPVVMFIGGDLAVRKAFVSLMELEGHPAETFVSFDAFWASYDPLRPGCIVVDVGTGPVHTADAFVRDPRLKHPVVILTSEDPDSPIREMWVLTQVTVVHTLDHHDIVGAINAALDDGVRGP